MAAGLTDRLWEASDLVGLLKASERKLESRVTRPSLSALSTTSFILAATGGLAPLIAFHLEEYAPFGRSAPLMSNIFGFCALVIGPAWLLLTSISLWLYRKRALRLLIGFPFAVRAQSVMIVYKAQSIPLRK
jgi:hypothetical protein